jgi:hypothetical protein
MQCGGTFVQLHELGGQQLAVAPHAVFPGRGKTKVGFRVVEAELAPVDVLFLDGLLHGVCAPLH